MHPYEEKLFNYHIKEILAKKSELAKENKQQLSFQVPSSSTHPPAPPKKQIKPLPPMSIKYPSCSNPCHEGEALNLYCTQLKCNNKPVICSFCYDQDHIDHQVVPVKVIIENARKYLNQNNQQKVNTDKIKGIVKESEKNLIQKYSGFNKEFQEEMVKVKGNIKELYSKLDKEVQLKLNGKETTDIVEKFNGVNNHSEYQGLVKDLILSVRDTLDEQNSDGPLSQNSLKQSINGISQKLFKSMSANATSVVQKLKEFMVFIRRSTNDCSLFSPIYAFSTLFHHQGITLLNPFTVKSTLNNDYYFALIQPPLRKTKVPQVFEFKIVNCAQSWVAVGICHKETVTANGFHFNYASVGHGGYLISANGGSWSTLDANCNNVVNSFVFTKNDVISVYYDSADKKVTWNKKNSKETHSMQVQELENDKLCLCVLFYYKGDQVEFLGLQKPE